MKKRKLFSFIGMLIILMVAGCKREEPPRDPDKIFELTKQEERILCDLYIDEERIREGKLYAYQERCLEQLRFAISYLEEKYADRDFEILTIHPKSKVNMRTTVVFYEVGDDENYHNLFVEPEGDGWIEMDDFESE